VHWQGTWRGRAGGSGTDRVHTADAELRAGAERRIGRRAVGACRARDSGSQQGADGKWELTHYSCCGEVQATGSAIRSCGKLAAQCIMDVERFGCSHYVFRSSPSVCVLLTCSRG